MTGTILVIDDDQAILSLIEDVLDNIGHAIRVFKSPLSAMEWTHNNPPASLALIDLMMPEISGEDVIARLHADDRYSRTPLIVLTASVDGRKVAERLGVAGCIRKPFDIDELRDEVERWLEQSARSI